MGWMESACSRLYSTSLTGKIAMCVRNINRMCYAADRSVPGYSDLVDARDSDDNHKPRNKSLKCDVQVYTIAQVLASIALVRPGPYNAEHRQTQRRGGGVARTVISTQSFPASLAPESPLHPSNAIPFSSVPWLLEGAPPPPAGEKETKRLRVGDRRGKGEALRRWNRRTARDKSPGFREGLAEQIKGFCSVHGSLETERRAPFFFRD